MNDTLYNLLSGTSSTIRRKCFISYYREDANEVTKFLADFEGVFIPKVIGVASGNDLIDSSNSDYVMSRIRTEYLGDSTVTICLLGECTHSRRYVDWELKASLRQGATYTPNGLIGIVLPSKGNAAHLPERFGANWHPEAECYAMYHSYPSSRQHLESLIEGLRYSPLTGHFSGGC